MTSQPQWWRGTLVLLGLCSVPTVLTSIQLHLQLIERDPTASWLAVLGRQAVIWYLWAPFTPYLLRLPRRFSLSPTSWARSALTMLIVSVVVVLIYSILLTAFMLPLEGGSLNLALLLSSIPRTIVTRLTNNLLLAWAIIGLGYAIDYHRKLRDREIQNAHLENELGKAQLNVLRMQLHPHFLFNTLHTVSSLVREGAKEDAVRMLAALSDLLRFSLDRIESQLVPLEDELEGLERYLEIAEIRFHDRLVIDRQIDPATLNALVPTLLLQPLVENALRHGIGADHAAGRITLRIQRDADNLEIIIEDDGPGPDRDAVGDGLGLRSTQVRIETLYGKLASVQLEPRLPKGTRLTVITPFTTTPPEPTVAK